MQGSRNSRNVASYSITDGDGRPQEHDYLQCCHCGLHFQVIPGSGTRRGFCMRCAKVTCGAEKCMACVPIEAFLDNVESGRPANHRDIVAPVGCTITPGGVIIP